MLTKKFISKTKSFKISFDISKEDATNINSVFVLGDFNEWSYENAFSLKKNKAGSFSGTFEIPAGRAYHFRYLVNDSEWQNEPGADRFEPSLLVPHIFNSVLDCSDTGKPEKTPAKKVAPKPESKAKTTKSRAKPKTE